MTDPRICYQTDPGGNTYTRVSSREAGSTLQPRLYIKFADWNDTSPPNAVSNLTAAAGQENGGVVLSFDAPVRSADDRSVWLYGPLLNGQQFRDGDGSGPLADPPASDAGCRTTGADREPDAGHDVQLFCTGV